MVVEEVVEEEAEEAAADDVVDVEVVESEGIYKESAFDNDKRFSPVCKRVSSVYKQIL